GHHGQLPLVARSRDQHLPGLSATEQSELSSRDAARERARLPIYHEQRIQLGARRQDERDLHARVRAYAGAGGSLRVEPLRPSGWERSGSLLADGSGELSPALSSRIGGNARRIPRRMVETVPEIGR